MKIKKQQREDFMSFIDLNGNGYDVKIAYDEHSAWLDGGRFGDIKLEKSPIFRARIKDTESSENYEVESNSDWEELRIENSSGCLRAYFSNPCGIKDIVFLVEGIIDAKGISWLVSVMNNSPRHSVMSVDYFVPSVGAEYFDLFVPYGSGMVVKDAGKKGYASKDTESRYPGGFHVMQYFAVYGKKSGIYIGIEDERECVKDLRVFAGDKRADISAVFYGINASVAANSFRLSGRCRWEYIEGDWYDATMLYANFVHKRADWLPAIAADGRADTPKIFKEIPFWVCDYIPNTPSQGDNKPMKLSAGSDTYDKDYWVDAVIKLQKELNVPIAYHVYNWHSIPFNIEYPHFLPAKDAFIEGAKRLREHNIYVLPYINAGSWEMHDAEMGHKVNFDNTGSLGTLINEDGSFRVQSYPQKTVKGETSRLANMCPYSNEWRTVIDKLVREMEETLPIDGIYFDQVAAIPAAACYNANHGHTLGGGNHWAEGYRLMMEKISAKRPPQSFYFSENNAENFIKCYDGLLTWKWVGNGQVPAFSAIYAGYVELIGRCTIGAKKEDYEFFKYCFAESLLYGQQLGWCKADAVYDEKRTAFLKKAVELRYRYTELFHSSDMLRPPRVETAVAPKVTTPALDFTEDLTMEQISAGAWRYRNGEGLVLFCYNISESEEDFSLIFSAKEYGLDGFTLPEDFKISGDTCTVCGTIPAESFKVWELVRK